MDYYGIGQRIRKYRKAQGLSQEQLAEMTGISETHMSHIETGNTKLSLQVFADIVSALEVQSDDLLFDTSAGRNTAINELSSLLDSCGTNELRIITDTVRSLKAALYKYR